jgi:hypothetical protein
MTPPTPQFQHRKYNSPPLPQGNQHHPLRQHSSTFELPYHPALQQFHSGKGPHDTTTNSNSNANTCPSQPQHARQPHSQMLAASPTAPPAERPIQVPVRVANPSDILPSSEQKASSNNGGGNLRSRLDLNLDVEVTLKANIKGDLTLALLQVPQPLCLGADRRGWEGMEFDRGGMGE